MFLQNLKKRLFSFFEKKINFFQNLNFKQFIEENFFNVLKVMLLITIFLVSLIIVIGLINFNKGKPSLNKTENIKDIDKNKVETIIDKDFLLENEFLYPEIVFFDITADYKNFMPLKKSKPPEISQIVNEYDFIFKDSIDDSLKFNFEKRRGK